MSSTEQKAHDLEYQSIKSIGMICILFSILIVGRSFSNIFLYAFVIISFIVFLNCNCFQCFVLLLYLLPSSVLFKIDTDGMSFFTVLFFITVLKMVLYYKKISKYVCFSLIVLMGYLLLFSGVSQLTTIITMIAGLLMISYLRIGSVNASLAVVLYALGICFSSILALFKDKLPIVNTFAHDMVIKLAENDYSNRFTGLQGNPNYYTLDIIIVMAALIVLMYTRKQKLIYSICFVGLSLFGIMSVSKSFLIVWLLLIICWFIISLNQGLNRTVKFIMVTIVTMIIIYYLAFDYINSFILRLQSDSIGTATSITTGRWDIWKSYLIEILSDIRIFIFGKGLNSLGTNAKGAHNTYLECLFQLGVIGSIAFVTSIRVCMGRILSNKIVWIPLGILFIRMIAIGILTYDSLWFYLSVILILKKEGSRYITAKSYMEV